MQIEFLDQVTEFGTQDEDLVVLFMQQAAGYRIRKGLPALSRIAARLAASWQRKEPVRVTVRGTEILDVRPAEESQSLGEPDQ